MHTKPLLAFDCSCPGASIALAVRGTIYTAHIPQQRQSAELVSTIDTLMQEQQVTYSQLGSIITTVGPGSFTGLRVGLAAAQGFALAATIPLQTLTSLTAMAWAIARLPEAPEQFLVHLRAGKGEVFIQAFTLATNGTPTAKSEITLAPETTTHWPLPCYGNMADPTSPHYLAGPDAALLCTIADHLPTSPLAAALPLYIRPPDAKIPAIPAWLA